MQQKVVGLIAKDEKSLRLRVASIMIACSLLLMILSTGNASLLMVDQPHLCTVLFRQVLLKPSSLYCVLSVLLTLKFFYVFVLLPLLKTSMRKFRYKKGTVGNTVCSSRPCSCPRPACRYKSHLTEFSSSSLSLLLDLVVLKQH